MARVRESFARALPLYIVLLPIVGMRAEAQEPGQPGDSGQPLDARPFDPPRPVDPQPPGAGGQIVFTPIAEPLTVRSLNGFSTDATVGFFSHAEHSHDGGVITVDSPWGERLKTRYWLTPHGVSFEYDDDLVVRYRFDQDGTLEEIEAESPYGEALMAVGNRAQLAAHGQRDFSSFDLSAYEVIEEAIRTKHSNAFLVGMREAQGALEASCATGIVLCAACIVAWSNTIPAVAAACVVGGVPTWGTACFLAILAHEAAGYGCAATCVNMVHECRGRPRGEVLPDGCEPRN